jgi:hypothetical protein
LSATATAPQGRLRLELAVLSSLLLVIILLTVEDVLTFKELIVVFRLKVEEGRDTVGLARAEWKRMGQYVKGKKGTRG